MANRRNANPFEQGGPTEYEQWNYVVGQANAQIIVELSTKVELLQQMIQEHVNHHAAANKAVLDLPAVNPTEKPN